MTKWRSLKKGQKKKGNHPWQGWKNEAWETRKRKERKEGRKLNNRKYEKTDN
jgi:hypothetical protein